MAWLDRGILALARLEGMEVAERQYFKHVSWGLNEVCRWRLVGGNGMPHPCASDVGILMYTGYKSS